ncbi:thymidylate synthase [Candidatus Peregrinibacteria bacterium]|nr:thymidylate synthase [Candidatus Peregrinibacteria bacterium]
MRQYLSLVEEVLQNGIEKKDRTGTGTISIFGVQRKYDLREGFPLLTTKKVRFDGVLRELLWFLKGSTNINDDLAEYTPIWNAWADENGDLGPIYGYQWRKWRKYVPRDEDGRFKVEHIDQIQNAIDTIKNNPDSRRIIVSAWNVSDLDEMKLPPCHAFFQFYVVNGRLDCQLYQRSADIALGVPFNIASYAALMMMVAKECGLEAGVFTHTLGDAHIYLNHIDGLKEQLKREPKKLPKLVIADKPFWDLKYEDFEIKDYEHDPFIKFKVAV